MNKQRIANLREALDADRERGLREFPDQTRHALEDERVCEAIDRRLSAGASIAGVHALEHDFYAGLNRIYFEFMGGPQLIRQSDAVLVILDGECQVVGLIDPFRPARPNAAIPPLPDPPASLPFVLQGANASNPAVVADADLVLLDDRTRRYFTTISRTGALSLPIGVTIGRDGGLLDQVCFANSDTTRCPGRCRVGSMTCKQTTGLFGGCDAWDWAEVPDSVADD